MTQTMSKDGTPIYFPASLATGDDSVILPVPPERLASIAGEVAADGLLLFAKRLFGAARKHHSHPRYAAINRQRLELARLCLDRAIGDEPAIVIELRAARETIAAEHAGLIADNGGEDALDEHVAPFVERLVAQIARIDAALLGTR